MYSRGVLTRLTEQIHNKEEKTIRLKGLRCDVVAKDDVYYIPFYDIDRKITENEIQDIDILCKEKHLSYILYKTKHGTHFVSLTPVNGIAWAYTQFDFKKLFNSYYGGIIIRLELKKDEKQELIAIHQDYGEVIPNLYNIFAPRFGLEKKPWQYQFSKYLLVFEKYKVKEHDA